MKCISKLLIILFCIGTSFAKEVDTKYFTLSFPDELIVESDDNKILVFGENGPYKKPYHFISIEFGNEIDTKSQVKGVNKTLEEFSPGSEVEKVKCNNHCLAYFGSGTKPSKTNETLNAFFYVIEGKYITVVISYITGDDYTEAKGFIDQIAKEVSSGSI